MSKEVNRHSDENQEGVPMNSQEVTTVEGQEKKRKPYDGRYAHGVTADEEHVKTSIAYDNALDRLKTRRNFLVVEYQEIEKAYFNSDNVSERAQLLKDKASKESQIKTIGDTRDKLENLEEKIKLAEREAQKTVEFKTFTVED